MGTEENTAFSVVGSLKPCQAKPPLNDHGCATAPLNVILDVQKLWLLVPIFARCQQAAQAQLALGKERMAGKACQIRSMERLAKQPRLRA